MWGFMNVLPAIILVTALGSAGSAASADVRDTLCASVGVMPGIGIGSIHIGDQFLDTVRRLGKPTGMWLTFEHDITNATPIRFTRAEDGRKGFVWADYGPNDRFVEIRAVDNVIQGIDLHGVANCSDTYGIGVDTPGSQVLDHYGQSYSTNANRAKAIAIVYNSIGIRFTVGAVGSGLGPVFSVMVFSPGHFCDIAGYTLCTKYQPPMQ